MRTILWPNGHKDAWRINAGPDHCERCLMLNPCRHCTLFNVKLFVFTENGVTFVRRAPQCLEADMDRKGAA